MTIYFQDSWLEDSSFSPWLQKGPDKKTAKRKKYQVCFNLSIMEKRALKSHMDGKKHVTKAKGVSYFFQSECQENGHYHLENYLL